MYRRMCAALRYNSCVFVVIYAVAEVQASDLSELLWGGRGSRTTVSDPYIPPPLITETPVVSDTDTVAVATMQSHLMLGTPGATTLPPGGVIAANGVAAGVGNTNTVWQNTVTTASNILPAVPTIPPQPVIDYEWTYSTIKDVKYEPVTVYDTRLGGYTTTWQERQTESVLPWLHRKQVVRYPTTTDDIAINGMIINSPNAPLTSDTSERRIVNRLFPVSAVPSPPAQAVPVETLPLPVVPVATYATVTYDADVPANPPLSSPGGSQIQSATIHSAASTVLRAGELPVVPAVTIPQLGSSTTQLTPETVVATPATTLLATEDQSAPISSSLADVPPSLPEMVLPSAQQVLYSTPDVPAGNASFNTTPPSTALGAARTSSPSGTPTLAPTRPDAGPGQVRETQESRTLQRPLLEDSIFDLEKPRAVELPPDSPLPPPAKASTIPSLEAAVPNALSEATATSNKTDSGIPLLLTTEPQSSAQPATRLRRSLSPTRMPIRIN